MTTHTCKRCGKRLKMAGRSGYGPVCAVYVLGPDVDWRTQKKRERKGYNVKRENRHSADDRQLPLDLEART